MNCRTFALASLLLGATAIASADAIVISINDKVMPMNNGFDPIVSNGRVLVPLRSVFEELAATVTWHEESKEIVVEKDNKVVKLSLYNKIAETQSGTVNMGAPARMYKNRVYIPLRFVSESIGAQVSWDPVGKRVVIRTFQDTAPPGSEKERAD